MKTLNQKNKQIEKQPLEYYLDLQYLVTLYSASEGGYVAQIKDLPGCLTQGETLDEAIANIQEAAELWIETAYEAGDEIPSWLRYSKIDNLLPVVRVGGLHDRDNQVVRCSCSYSQFA